MSQIETFRYDDEIVRKFLLATIVWGVVGLLLGVIIATQLVFWETNLGPWFWGFGSEPEHCQPADACHLGPVPPPLFRHFPGA